MARPEPMNATATHSKVKVSLYFPDPLFIAGEHVAGKMELECKAERGLGIGDIRVELFAIQELTSRDHSATNTFMHLTRYFQGPGLPPSNAVHPHPLPGNDDMLPVDCYLARKGTTTFFFRFPLPVSSPASIDFGKGLAKLKYEVRGSASVSWRGERQRVLERKEISVIEAPGDASDVEGVVVGENGKIWAQGRILNPYIVGGRDACIELFVKNHSSKRTASLSLTLSRHLHLPTTSHLQKSLQISDILANVPFRGPDYIVQPGTEGIANLVFSVPKNAQGVRAGRLETGEEEDGREPVESLFDVRCIIEIKIGMGFGSKDIIFELPVSIVHPAAMQLLPPSPELFAPPPELPQRLYSPPVHSVYQSPPLGPTYDLYPTAYMSPPMSLPILTPNVPVWSPPPQAVPPVMMMHDQHYYYPPPPLMEYAYPARPSSADPFVAGQLPALPTQPTNLTALPPTQNGVISTGISANPDSREARPEQGEPGKGERASRIAAHLRMSSRNRSVSPPAHRFPQTSLAPVPDNAPATLQVTQSPVDTVRKASPTEEQQVLSPRPVLTPKQSFSFDRGTVKSEHVIDLERMAAEELESQNKNNERNKSLPRPPALDAPTTPRLPPEPTLQPVPTRPRPEIWARESGLAALEAKLLEQVGTRKPDTDRRIDVRSVLPGPIAIPSPNDPRCDPLNDSAISSLALGANMSLDRLPSPALHVDDEVLTSTPAKPAVSAEKDRSPDRRTVNGKEKGKRSSHTAQLRKAATGRVAAWLGGLQSASPPEADTAPISSPLSPTDDLPSKADIDPHPLLRSPAVPTPETSDVPKADGIPTRSSGFILHNAKDTSSTFEVPKTKSSKEPRSPTSPKEPAPTLHSPLANSLSPPKPVLRRIAEFPNKRQLLEHKYDIRSARGGRGGKVTSVAALWSSLASQQEPPSSAARPTEKAGTFSPTFKGSQPKMSPSDKHKAASKTPPHTKKQHDDVNTNVGDLTARRARMVKSTSVPAVVSSSLATPVLSSTASLARPIQVPYPKGSYPLTNAIPTIAEQPASESATPRAQSVKSPAASDLAFGQARLKDLIRKYQQGFGQQNGL